MNDDTQKQQTNESETETFGGAQPQRIGEYQLVRCVGGGGMGVVYEALHTRLKKRVAVKLLSEAQSGKRSAWRRFSREMEVFGKLEHPHVVLATDAGEVDGVPYLVMEYIDGADLARVVRQHGPLPPLAALDVMQQAAEALGHIHSHGLVHRDIKPSNMLLNKWGVVKVADLGLAQLLDPGPETEEITSMGDFVGTVDFMSPEQGEHPGRIDHRADIYSLGCSLYFLLAGDTVFPGTSKLDRLVAHRTNPPPDLPPWRGIKLPDSLNRLFHEMVAKDPAERPQTVGAILQRLRSCREQVRTAIGQVEEDFVVGQHALPADAGIEETSRVVFSTERRPDDTPTLAAPRRPTTKPPVARRAAFWIAGLAVAVLIGLFGIPPLLRRDDSQNGQGATGSGQSGGQSQGQQPPALPAVLGNHQTAIFSARISPDGKFVLSTDEGGKLRVWDLTDRKSLHVLGEHKGTVINLAFIPETDLAVTACFDGSAYVWDWPAGRLDKSYKQHVGHVESIVWVKDNLVLTSGVTSALILWNAASGEVMASLSNDHQGGVRALAVDPTRRFVVSGDYEGNLFHWDLETKSLVSAVVPMPGKSIKVWCLDWSSDPNRIAIGGKYGDSSALLLVYDLSTREVVHEFKGHTWKVNAVRFSRDGKKLYSAGENVRAWSLETLEPLFTFDKHESEVYALDESPDGALLISGDTSGALWLSSARP